MAVFHAIVDKSEIEPEHAPAREIAVREPVTHTLTGEDIMVQGAGLACDDAYLAWCTAWRDGKLKRECDVLFQAYIKAYENAQQTAREYWGLTIPASVHTDPST